MLRVIEIPAPSGPRSSVRRPVILQCLHGRGRPPADIVPLLPYARIGHLIELTLFYEKLDSKVDGDQTEITRKGVEVVAARSISLRLGHTDDPEGDIQAPSEGVGLGLEWLGLPSGISLEWAE